MLNSTLAPSPQPDVRARQRLTLDLGAEPEEVGRARRRVRSCLTAWGLAEVADPVLLVLSELVTNAVRHAPCRVIELTATAGDTELLIEVRDGSQNPPVMSPEPEPEGESGRGLHIVQLLSSRWGWTPHDDGTKTAWAVLPTHAPSALSPGPVPVCGERSYLLARLVPKALAYAAAGSAETADVERHLRCTLQAHTTGDHHAFVMELDQGDAAVWDPLDPGPPPVRASRPAGLPGHAGGEPRAVHGVRRSPGRPFV